MVMSKIDFSRIPKFSDLPVRKGAPSDSNWGVFGDDDEVGCVNFLTEDGIVEAARLVRNGKVFRLEIRPHPFGEMQFSIGAFPEQEV